MIKLTAVHPDQHAPEPWPEEQKAEFLRLQRAIQFIEGDDSSYSSTAMVPASVITDLVAAIRDSRESRSESAPSRKSVEEAAAKTEATQLLAVQRANDPPRRTAIVLSSLWTLLGGLFLLPSSQATNPFVARLLAIPNALLWWMGILIVGLATVATLFAREEVTRREIQRLFSFDVQQSALAHLIRDERAQIEYGNWDPEFDGPSPYAFSRHFLQLGLRAELGLRKWPRAAERSRQSGRTKTKKLTVRSITRALPPFIRRVRLGLIDIPDEAFGNAADLCLDRLLTRGRIRPIDPRTGHSGDWIVLDDWFELVPPSQ